MLKWMLSLPLFIVVISISSVQAQFNLAVSAGFNSGNSQLYNVDDINTTNKRVHTTFYTGIIPSYQFNEKMKISSELQYSEVGTSFRVFDFNPENDHCYYAEGRYLRLIPQLEVLVLKNFYMNGGPNIGLMIDSESKESIGMGSPKNVPHYGKTVSNFDMGVSVGMKYYLHPFFINVSYYQGITDISKISYTNGFGEVIPNTSQRNHYIQFGLGAQLFSASGTK